MFQCSGAVIHQALCDSGSIASWSLKNERMDMVSWWGSVRYAAVSHALIKMDRLG